MWLQYFGQPYLPHGYEPNNAPVKKPKPSKKRKKKDNNEPQKYVRILFTLFVIGVSGDLAYCSGNDVAHVNQVTLRRIWLVIGWVTVRSHP